MYARFTEASIANAPPGRRPEIRRAALERPRPAVLPAFSGRLLVDDRDHLWVQSFAIPGESTTAWSVFDREGRYLGDVHVPASFRPMEVRAGRVLGVWRSELDVETVRAYRLHR